MTARCISFSGDKATVVLTPCWFTRMFGARTLTVDIEKRKDDWFTVATGRAVDHNLPHGLAIRDALDFRAVGSPSRWALESGEATAP